MRIRGTGWKDAIDVMRVDEYIKACCSMIVIKPEIMFYYDLKKSS